MVAVAVIVAAAHAPHITRADPPPLFDSATYIAPARMLLRVHRFVDHDPITLSTTVGVFPPGPIRPDTFRTPGYPLFLAAIFLLGGGLPAVGIVQHGLVIFFSALMFHFLARELGAALGAVAAILFGVWPAVVESSGTIMTESITAILVALAAAAFYLGLRRNAVLPAGTAGLLFAIAALVRPIVLYLPAVLVVVLIARRRRAAAIVVFAIASFLLPAAWAMRNAIEAGVPVVSSVGGENLLMYRAVGAMVVKDMPPQNAIFALQRQFGFYGPALKMRPPLARLAIARATADGIPPAQLSHARLSRYYRRMGLQMLASHPLATLEVSISSFIALYFDQFATSEFAHGMNAVDVRIRLVPIAVGLFVLAVYGVISIHRRNRDAGITIAVILLYFSILSAGPEVEPRFIVPYCALYTTAIAAGAVDLFDRAFRARKVSG